MHKFLIYIFLTSCPAKKDTFSNEEIPNHLCNACFTVAHFTSDAAIETMTGLRYLNVYAGLAIVRKKRSMEGVPLARRPDCIRVR